MNALCQIGWHQWKKWSMVPSMSISNDGNKPEGDWYAGLIRQCDSCWLIESRRLGMMFNMRSLRTVVMAHVKDLKGVAEVIGQSEHAQAFDATRLEILKAADELTEAVNKDMAIPRAS